MELEKSLTAKIPFDSDKLKAFCQKFQIKEFYFFGSVLTDGFSPESDVDVMVAPLESARWSLFDHVEMKLELEALFRRPVDLITRAGLERSSNYIRRKNIMNTA